MTPTEIDDERLREKSGESVLYDDRTFERRKKRRWNTRTKNKTTNEQSNDENDDEDDEKKGEGARRSTREKTWRNTRTKQKEKNDPQFRPLPECRLWPHRTGVYSSRARENRVNGV